MDRNLILSSLKRFRYLFDYIIEDSDNIIKDLGLYMPLRHMVFPCDIVELRGILEKEEILEPSPISLFSHRFADKHLKNYSVFLVIDVSGIKSEIYKYGGLCIVLSGKLDISNNLYRIIVNEPSSNNSFNIVKKITKDLNIGAECLVSNSIPGLSSSNPKLSFSSTVIK